MQKIPIISKKNALKKTKILITWLKILKICLDGVSILPNALIKVILFTAYIYAVCEIRLTFAKNISAN